MRRVSSSFFYQCSFCNVLYGLDDLEKVFNVTKPKIVVCYEAKTSLIKEALKDIDSKVLNIDNSSVDILFKPSETEATFALSPVGDTAATPAFVACTSGTTGSIKVVKISQAQVIAGIDITPVTHNDVAFFFCATNWITNSMLIFGTCFAGASLVMTGKTFTPDYQSKIIETYKVSYMGASPWLAIQFLEYLKTHKHDLTSVRRCFMGGVPVSEAVKDMFKKAVPNCKDVASSYASTEAFQISENINPLKNGSVGQPHRLMKIKVHLRWCYI